MLGGGGGGCSCYFLVLWTGTLLMDLLFNMDVLTLHVMQLEWIEEPSLRLQKC